MIFYFSGTGNSKYVATRIADALGDELFSLNARIKANDTSAVEVGGRLVIVTPTHAWRLPRVVQDWLMRTELVGAGQVWIVMTCGSEIGNAAQYNRALCAKKGLTYMGTAQVIMPENYIAMFDAPQAAEAREIVKRTEPFIDSAAECIAAGRALPPPRNNFSDRVKSGPVNPAFYAFCVRARAFAASDACIGCGKCAQLCPTNNVSIQNGKPVWGDNCNHCMACICYCPTEAIEYGKKSLGKPRYHFEAL